MSTLKIHSFRKDNNTLFDRNELQKLIGISNRGIWRKWLISCGYDPDNHNLRYSWQDVIILLALKIFLGGKKGRHRHTYIEFYDLRSEDNLSDELLSQSKQLMEQLKNDYYQNEQLSA